MTTQNETLPTDSQATPKGLNSVCTEAPTLEEEVCHLRIEVKRLRQFIRKLARHQHNPNTGRILYETDIDYEV